MTRHAFLLALFLVPGCTFNTRWLEASVTAEGEPGEYTTFVFDGPSSGASDTSLEIRGFERPTSSAEAVVVGLLGMNDDEGEVLSAFDLEWTRIDAETVSLDASDLDAPSGFWIDRIHASVPVDRDLAIDTEGGSVAVSNVTGRVAVRATSGSISVAAADVVDLEATSGSIDVLAHTGRVSATSGSIHLSLTGGVEASATSGSIDGTIGGGGSLVATSGSIEIELRRPLDHDLVLEADSGSIHLMLPAGASAVLDLAADSGSVEIETRDVSHHGDDFEGVIGDGGFRIRARASSGSIEVLER